MADVFESILGQPDVRAFLRATVSSGRVGQSYLFCGPAGSSKTQAADALAAAVLCADGGCGACDTCKRVMRRKHPDVRHLVPEGANAYLVEQVRELVADTSLAPIQSNRKVYILDRVDRLGAAAANAFLKTLEEPPDDVVFILLARTRDGVLPTIVSRCQVVPFQRIPESEAAGIIVQNTGVSPEQARIALASCNGSLTRAVGFLRSNESLAFRRSVVEVMAMLRHADDWDVVEAASKLVVAVKAPLDVVRAQQEAELAENADFLAKSAIRQIEARNKRALSAKSLESLRQLTSIAASYVRDLLMVCAGTPDLIINTDMKAQIADDAAATDEARCACALRAQRRCDAAIAYNVSPETCIDALLFEIREALYGTHRAR